MNDAVLPIDSANRALLLMHALCHDNTEAYLVDLPSPVKRHPALRDPYKALESNLHEVILEALGVGRCNAAHNHAIVWADLYIHHFWDGHSASSSFAFTSMKHPHKLH